MITTLCGKKWNTSVGNNLPVRISLALGINELSDITEQQKFLIRLSEHKTVLPDILVALSTMHLGQNSRFYDFLLESFGGPIGFLPHYLCSNKGIIDENRLKEEVFRSIEAGISHLTIHITATRELLEDAKKTRLIPSTSRGGGMVLNDLIRSKQETNVFQRILPDILEVLIENNVAISLGSTFRPAATNQALDEVHLNETKEQLKFAKYLKNSGVGVLMEGIGHISLSDIDNYFEILAQADVVPPLMTLGPLTNDCELELDPISAAIGISACSKYPQFAISQVITSQEHLGGIPDKDSSIQGLRIAKSAARASNLNRGFSGRDSSISFKRETQSTCVIDDNPTQKGCDRCHVLCPLFVASSKKHSPIRQRLIETLPSEITQDILSMLEQLETFGGKLVLFGSTAKGEFAYSRTENELRLLSDIELNIICDSIPDLPTERRLNELIKKCTQLYNNQPLFDIDVRFRTNENLSQLDYNINLRKELFCTGISSTVIKECTSEETDMILHSELKEFLRSALEWTLLRIVHLSKLEKSKSEKNWWIQAIRMGFIIKVSPIFMHKLGLPYRGRIVDMDLIDNLGTLKEDEKRYFDLFRYSRRAKSDRSGKLLGNETLSHSDLEMVISDIVDYLGEIPDFQHSLIDLVSSEDCWIKPNLIWIERVQDVFGFILSDYRGKSELFENKYKAHLY